MTLAALGGSVAFDTLDDARDLAIAAGTQSGTVIPLKGLGVPKIRGRGRGDLFVHVQVDTPTGLDDGQRELLAALAEARGEDLGTPRRARDSSRSCAPPSADHGDRTGPSDAAPPPGPDPVLVSAAAMVFVDDPTAPILTQGDAHHLLDVLRLRPGRVGGGRRRRRLVGARAGWPRRPAGAVAAGGPGRAAGRRTVRWRTSPGPAPEITVAFAPTKGDRPEWVVQKLTELGRGPHRAHPDGPLGGALGGGAGRTGRGQARAGWPGRPRPSAAGPGCPR